MGAEHPAMISTCFYGVYNSTYPTDKTNYYYYGWGPDELVSESRFCERWAKPYRIHEYINSFSALFIAGMGFYQLTWDHSYGIIRFLGGCFFVNGIGSFLNHWFATRDWSVIDGSSMYVPAWLLLAAILESIYQIMDFEFLHNNPTSYRGPLIRGLLWGFVSLVIWGLLYNDMNGCGMGVFFDFIFPLGFGIPPLVLAGVGIWAVPKVYKIIDDRYLKNDKHFGFRFEQSVVYFSWGVSLALIGASLWILLEAVLCNNALFKTRKSIGYFPIHAMWHIVESYALSLLMVFFTALTSVRNQMHTDWRFPKIKQDDKVCPDFGIKSAEVRILSTNRLCCGPCKSSVCDKILNIIFPIPTTSIEEDINVKQIGTQIETKWCYGFCCDSCCCNGCKTLDATFTTRLGGCCRCWVGCVEKCGCCGGVHHYPVSCEADITQTNTELLLAELTVTEKQTDKNAEVQVSEVQVSELQVENAEQEEKDNP